MRLRKVWEKISYTVDIRDLVCAAGLLSVWHGLAMAYEPAAWVVVGLALFWLAVR